MTWIALFSPVRHTADIHAVCVIHGGGDGMYWADAYKYILIGGWGETWTWGGRGVQENL